MASGGARGARRRPAPPVHVIHRSGPLTFGRASRILSSDSPSRATLRLIMHREYHRWFSPSLGRDMELLIFGHAGARVLVFPTSFARFHEWEDRGLIHGALGEHIRRGWLQVYCVDTVDGESWYARHRHP